MQHSHKYRILTIVVALVLAGWGAGPALADISKKQVRTLIARMAGMKLANSDVRVVKIDQLSEDTAEANVELNLVFRFVQNKDGQWSIREVRTGQDRWEDLNLIAEALKVALPHDSCREVSSARQTSELTVHQARCLVADLFAIELPSDAVRIKEISTLGIPGGTETSAIVITRVESGFRLRKSEGGWQVTELRTGSHDWLAVSGVSSALDQVKRIKATEDLKLVADALGAYRKARGSYLVSDKNRILIDHLSPVYLKRVIRLDPWFHPYQYQGDRSRFTLRSDGPDGKADTADDIVISGPSQE